MNIRPATLLAGPTGKPTRSQCFIAGSTDDLLFILSWHWFCALQNSGTLAPDAKTQPLPELHKYAASFSGRETVLTTQTINGLISGSTVPLSRQLAAIQKTSVAALLLLERCSALVFPVNLSTH